MFPLLADTQTMESANWPLEIVKIGLPAIFGFLGAWLGLFIWHRQKRSEPKYQSMNYLEQKRLDGLLKAWSLLAYMTEVENPKAAMVWDKKGDTSLYYLRLEQARKFISALSEMFYDGGFGLLLNRTIKDLLYEYRGHIYGILLKAQSCSGENDRIRLENMELVSRLKGLYNEVNTELRKELQKIEK